MAHFTDEAFLGVLRVKGVSSRSQIAQATGFSKPTISDCARRLQDSGLIAEYGIETSIRGRPVPFYGINPDYGHVLGLEIRRRRVMSRVVDFSGRVITEDVVDTDHVASSVPTALALAHGLVERSEEAVNSPRLATGVVIAAPIDPRASSLVQWPDAPFSAVGAEPRTALGIAEEESLLIDNNANWATLAEHRVGSMKGVSDFLYVHLGATIGAGMVLADRLYRGSSGLAGQIAFTKLEDDDTLMHKLARSVIGTYDPWGGSIDALRAFTMFIDPDTAEAVAPVIDDIGYAIATIATAIDPGHIVLGGPLSAAYPLVNGLRERIKPLLWNDITITTTTLGIDAPLRGAVIGALEYAEHNRKAEPGSAAT